MAFLSVCSHPLPRLGCPLLMAEPGLPGLRPRAGPGPRGVSPRPLLSERMGWSHPRMPRHPCADHPSTHSGPQAVKLTVCGAGADGSRCTRLEDSVVSPAREALPGETWIQAPEGSLMALLLHASVSPSAAPWASHGDLGQPLNCGMHTVSRGRVHSRLAKRGEVLNF